MVFFVNGNQWKLIFGYDNDTYGRTIYDTKTVSINNEAHKQDLRSVITHELTHVFMWEYGFSQVEFNHEIVCDFVGRYGEEIVYLASKLLEGIIKMKGSSL